MNSLTILIQVTGQGESGARSPEIRDERGDPYPYPPYMSFYPYWTFYPIGWAYPATCANTGIVNGGWGAGVCGGLDSNMMGAEAAACSQGQCGQGALGGACGGGQANCAGGSCTGGGGGGNCGGGGGGCGGGGGGGGGSCAG
jgi:hypothetical protein